MRRVTSLLLCSALVLVPVVAGHATSPTGTPYQAASVRTSCGGGSGVKACTFEFPKVATGMTLTITHVSCYVVTAGFSGGVTQIALFSSQYGIGKLADTISFLPVTNGSDLATLASEETTFFVNGGFSPTIAVSTDTAAIVVLGQTPECFVSGYTN